MRRTAPRPAGKICLLTAALGLTVPAPATAAPAPVPQARSVTLPVDGTFAGPREKVRLAGTLVVTVVTAPDAAGGGTARIVSGLDDAEGTGEPSGGTYGLAGTQRDSLPFSAAATTTLTVRPALVLTSPAVPPAPAVQPDRVRPVMVSVTVTADGVIGAVTAVVGPPAS
ncbi:hypothetical protein [Streptomyces sp. NPDC048663]|uniref:hypothetical protein n=1 Tax=Streptomyces sp. NPDC048663 TaxID=3155638 RepID=UPI0034401260